MIALRFQCYEPPGKVFEVSDEVLCRHLLVTGATGSGKTTGVVTPALEQLIAYDAQSARRRIGLLVLDGKGDSTPERVWAMARSSGRAEDVEVLSEQGGTCYDLFGGFRHLSQLDDFARRFLARGEDMGPMNQFWQTARSGFVSSALALLLASSTQITFRDALRFMQDWWFGSDRKCIEPRLEFVQRVLENSQLSEASRQRVALALTDVDMWFSLDARSRACHRASLCNAIRPLLSVPAQALFDTDKPKRFVPAEALDGRLMIVSFDGQRHPEIASLLLTLIKGDFVAAVHRRGDVIPGMGRLVGLVCDEYPLVAEPQDAEFLATARSRGAFVLAATQSLLTLDARMGRCRREALLSQFNSHFFFNSREAELNGLAHVIMGTKLTQATKTQSCGNLLEEFPSRVPIREPVCELGALAQLGAHHAFVRLADGTRSEGPVWLESKFYDLVARKAEATAPEQDDLARAVGELRPAGLIFEARQLREAAAFLAAMLKGGRRMWLSAPIVQALGDICAPRSSREGIVRDLEALKHFRGLADLPACWLAGIRSLFAKRKVLASAVRGFGVCDSLLVLDLESGVSVAERSSFLLHETVNLWVYPSLWRRARTKDLNLLWAQRPHLRPDIAQLPQRNRTTITHSDPT